MSPVDYADQENPPDPLQSLIAEILESENRGAAVDREALFAEHPEYADSLREFFAGNDRMRSAAAGNRQSGSLTAEEIEHPTVPPSSRSEETLHPPSTAPLDLNDPSSGPSTSARYFGEYEILREIARGGMGVVYKARQTKLNRIVAIKMILSGNLANQEDIRRFYVEAEAAANLQHANIVAIHEVGEVDGQHFFSMDYVEGESLAERIGDHPLAASQAATYVQQIAEAIDYANSQGILHRDLKPSNVLIDRSDRPRVTDFGLAKRVDDDSGLTGTGQVLGTPAYMPPEQASGSTAQIGPASDVYGIGAILYALLTGRPPFRAETQIDTIMQVLDAQPVPPRMLNGTVPADLQTVCLKCLEKNPAERYQSAGELAQELERFLAGEAIHASSINLLDRVTRAIAQSRNEEHFRSWGLALIVLGVTIFLSHAWMFAMEQITTDAAIRYWIPRAVMFVLLFGMLCYARPKNLLPTNSAERLIWVVWTGYLFALLASNAVLWVRGREPAEIFVVSSLLSGYGFFIMGHHVWGGCYVMGMVFFAAAPVFAHYGAIQSLAYGALWGASLSALGCHYRYGGTSASASNARIAA